MHSYLFPLSFEGKSPSTFLQLAWDLPISGPHVFLQACQDLVPHGSSSQLNFQLLLSTSFLSFITRCVQMSSVFKDLPFILGPFISHSRFLQDQKHLEDVMFSCLLISPSPWHTPVSTQPLTSSFWQPTRASWTPTTSQDPKTSPRLSFQLP